MASAPESNVPASVAYRKLIRTSVAALCKEAGIDSMDEIVLESLVELAQSFLTETGRSSSSYCELASRTEPIIGDVIMGLISMGFSVSSLSTYAFRPRKVVLPTPVQMTLAKPAGILHTGQKRPHPSHIPDHLPEFPDSHAYIATPTHKQPIADYETVREKAACQKRDVERALTRFVAKTGETQSFFLTPDTTHFPLIACKPTERPYLSALIPKDQVFEEDESVVYMKKQEEMNAEAIKIAKAEKEKQKEANADNPNALMNESINEQLLLENPFMQPVKMPSAKAKIH